MSHFARLTPGDAARDGDVADVPATAPAPAALKGPLYTEGQDVGRRVFAAELAVELTDFAIGDEGDGHRAARAGRRDAAQPGGQTGGAQAPPAAVT